MSHLIIIVAPHTSNFDFLYGIATVFALGVKVHWMGKHTLFRGPLGPVLKRLGGIPVNRVEPQGTIERLAGLFRREDKLALCITPEGTRKPVARWKTGFYRISVAARVPIILGFLDYGSKTVGIGPVIIPTGTWESDVRKIIDFYRNKVARHPDRFNPDPEVTANMPH